MPAMRKSNEYFLLDLFTSFDRVEVAGREYLFFSRTKLLLSIDKNVRITAARYNMISKFSSKFIYVNVLVDYATIIKTTNQQNETEITQVINKIRKINFYLKFEFPAP